MKECVAFDIEGDDGIEPPLVEGPCRALGIAGGSDPAMAIWRWRDQERRFAAYGRSRHFAVLDACRPRGQLSIFLNSRLGGDGRTAYFGLVELFAQDAASVLEILLDAAEDWCRQNGAGVLRGPIAYSTWYPNRFVARELTEQRFPGDSPYPAWLTQHFLDIGFEVCQEYFSVISEPLVKFVPRIAAAARFAAKRGVRFEQLRGTAVARVFPEAHAICQNAFAGNFSFTPIDYREFTSLYGPAHQLPGALAISARDAAGNLLGFVFGYEAPGFQTPGDEEVKVAVLKSIAVEPQASALMVGPALSAEFHRIMSDPPHGCGRVIHALMARQHYALGTGTDLVSPLREYVMLERPILPAPASPGPEEREL
ncbi:MAG: hypothetical protein HYY25_05340 [Candidatus Wallbacteria bacterium]|nr:hypothetical protein [Candidatus Wallbacteria bacterium]